MPNIQMYVSRGKFASYHVQYYKTSEQLPNATVLAIASNAARGRSVISFLIER